MEEEKDNSNIPEEILNDTSEEQIIDVQPPEEEKKKGKKRLTDEQREKLKLNIKKAQETREKYKTIRKELGLGKNDPIPDKYLIEKAPGYKKNQPYKKIEKTITKDDDEQELIKEVAKKKKEKILERDREMEEQIIKKREYKKMWLSDIISRELDYALERHRDSKEIIKRSKKLEKEPEDKPQKKTASVQQWKTLDGIVF
jgi:hypothetical protein